VRRRILREKVLQALYAHEITHDPLEMVIANQLKTLEKERQSHIFAERLVRDTVRHKSEIDKVIRGKVANWDFKRIALLDRLILRMAICEILHFDEIPPKVTLNEAIELAKLFSTEKSGQFVNGVLDALFRDMRQTGEIHKSGRGLYDGGGRGRAKPLKERSS
jgi:N utilization substance protein B